MTDTKGVGPALCDDTGEALEVRVAPGERDGALLKPLTPEDQALFGAYLTSAIRSAVLRAKLDANELTSIGLALSNGWIGPESAIKWLHEIGMVDVVLHEVEASTIPEAVP